MNTEGTYRYLTKRTFKYSPRTSIRERLQNYFAKDSSNALKIRALDLIIKTLTLILYIIQTCLSDLSDKNNDDVKIILNITQESNNTENLSDIEWKNILFVRRNYIYRYVQLVLSMHGIFDLIFFMYLYNDDILRKIEKSNFLIGLLTTVPWFLEVSVPNLKNMFIPMFLTIWLIKRDLKQIFQNYNVINAKIITNHKIHQSLIRQELILLVLSFICLIITSTFGFFHLQQGSPNKKISVFDSFYFTIITFSTVGYGDISPDLWVSKLYMSIIIMVALFVIPKQVEHVVRLLVQKRSLGDSYNKNFLSDKHIVVCSGNLQYDLIYHFLHEFYKNRKNQHTKTILFSTSELDKHLNSLLNTPLWKQRVFYIYGSVLRSDDLGRAKIKSAKAVFLMSSRGIIEKDLSDQQTILRSWSIKRYAPKIPQYIQLFRPENKIHVNFAEHLICEDELKYALLASNCIFPGISTFITILMNKITEEDKSRNRGKWQELYGELASNEINSIMTSNSNFFKQFIGEPFHRVSRLAHKLYNVCLVGVSANRYISTNKRSHLYYHHQSISEIASATAAYYTSSDGSILLNPGKNYIIQSSDILYYISLQKDENFVIKETKNAIFIPRNPIMVRMHSIYKDENSTLLSSIEKSDENIFNELEKEGVLLETPKNQLYIGCYRPTCILLKNTQKICCLELNVACDHKPYKHATEYKWKNNCIIVAALHARISLFNFIAILRSKNNLNKNINPIVLLLENNPSIEFLESIRVFPLVYWIKGNISNISILRKAGIEICDTLIIVSVDKNKQLDDDYISDSKNIFAVHNIKRLFKNIKIISELTNPSNIRFFEQIYSPFNNSEEFENDNHFMYSLPFAAGNIFFASMIDTLLYQAYYKPYIIEFVRLLIGMNQFDNFGYLKKIQLKENDLNIETYGNLYEKLIHETGEIPIGIYRTEKNIDEETFDAKLIVGQNSEYISYVLINPYDDIELKLNDIIYTIRPHTNQN